jgi:ribonuclease E
MQEASASRPQGVVVSPEFESAAQRRAAGSTQQAVVYRPQVAAELAAQGQRSAESEASVAQAAALLPEEPEALDVWAVLRRAEHAAEAPKAAQPVAVAEQAEVVAPGAAVEPQREAAVRVEAAAPQPEAVVRAVAAEVARRREARDAAGVLHREVRDARAAALPSAAPWVFHQAQAPPWPARSPAAQFARAMKRLRIASP